jgi:hypothetical protein
LLSEELNCDSVPADVDSLSIVESHPSNSPSLRSRSLAKRARFNGEELDEEEEEEEEEEEQLTVCNGNWWRHGNIGGLTCCKY